VSVCNCCCVRCYDPTYQVNPVTGLCEPVPDCSVDHCYHGDCVVIANSFYCNCYDGWHSTHCNETGPITGPQAGGGDSDVHIAAIIVPIILGILLLCELIFFGIVAKCIAVVLDMCAQHVCVLWWDPYLITESASCHRQKLVTICHTVAVVNIVM